MSLLIGALTLGLIMSILSLGIFITFRIFDQADITVDGSITFGASVAAALLVMKVDPLIATAAAFGAGALAGTLTGILQTKFRINALLSGILVMTALYSVNLHVMGRSNVSVISETTLSSWSDALGLFLFGGKDTNLFGWIVSSRDLSLLALMGLLVTAVSLLLYWFFQTQIGCAMRATGNNRQMVRALGVNVELYIAVGLCLSNALVGLSGALMCQYQSFADAQMGIGTVVYGLASVIIGESLVGAGGLGYSLIGTVMGSVLFRLLIAVALRWGLNPNDLKLITALFVFAALVLPSWTSKLKRRSPHAAA